MVHLFKPTSYSFGAALAVGATLAWKLVWSVERDSIK